MIFKGNICFLSVIKVFEVYIKYNMNADFSNVR